MSRVWLREYTEHTEKFNWRRKIGIWEESEDSGRTGKTRKIVEELEDSGRLTAKERASEIQFRVAAIASEWPAPRVRGVSSRRPVRLDSIHLTRTPPRKSSRPRQSRTAATNRPRISSSVQHSRSAKQ